MHTLLIREALCTSIKRTGSSHHKRIFFFDVFFANTTRTTVSRRAIMSGLWSHVEAAPKVITFIAFHFFFWVFFPGIWSRRFISSSLSFTLSLSLSSRFKSFSLTDAFRSFVLSSRLSFTTMIHKMKLGPNLGRLGNVSRGHGSVENAPRHGRLPRR